MQYETYHHLSRLHLCLAETLVCLPREQWERFLSGAVQHTVETTHPAPTRASNGGAPLGSLGTALAAPGCTEATADTRQLGFRDADTRGRGASAAGASDPDAHGVTDGQDMGWAEGSDGVALASELDRRGASATVMQPYDLETNDETIAHILQLADLIVHHQKTLGDMEALFMITEEPLSVATLAESLHSEPAIIADLCSYLQTKYRMQGFGFTLRYIAGGYRLWSSVKHASAVESHIVRAKSGKLSRAMTETLAIIAFKQPITRAQMSAIRGVDADVAVRSLLSRGLIEEQGRSDDPGRPMTYGTSQYFLERMGITSLDALPALDTFAPAGTPPPEPAIAEYKTARRLVDMMDDPKEETLAFQTAMAKADLAVETLNANLQLHQSSE